MDSCEEINIIKGILNARCRGGATVEDIQGNTIIAKERCSFNNNNKSFELCTFSRRFHGIHW